MDRPDLTNLDYLSKEIFNAEVTGAARPYCAASVLTAKLGGTQTI